MSDDARHQAIQRLHQRRGFINYILGAVLVSAFMVVIWFLSGRGYFWPVWVMGAFLIGIIFYGVNQAFNKPLTEEQIQREMAKDQ